MWYAQVKQPHKGTFEVLIKMTMMKIIPHNITMITSTLAVALITKLLKL